MAEFRLPYHALCGSTSLSLNPPKVVATEVDCTVQLVARPRCCV